MTGIIKHKYSDFHVHEIDKYGVVQYLTSLDPLPLPPYPEGYEEWLASKDIFFTFKPDTDDQVSRIYYEQPNIEITLTRDECTLERTLKRRIRPLVTSFVLCKENLNQPQVISFLSKKTGKPKRNIGFSGTKDKRGITTQVVTIKEVPISRLQEIAPTLGDSIKIGQYKQVINPISLGDNQGNRFTLLIRDVKIPENASLKSGIERRLLALEENGFLNYFGMQRFGTGKIPTHQYGIHILRQEWDELIKIFITPQEGELESTHKAKLIYQRTHDPVLTLQALPKSAQSEISIFKAMSELPKDKQLKNPCELFKRIDRRQRMMYVHAYQSYLWNHILTQRWKKYGNEIVEGDYVQTKEGEIIQITNNNRNNFSIFDVVIKLPSKDEMSCEMIELMAKDNVTPKMFNDLASEYGAGGDWRKILIKPLDLEWELISHNNLDDLLIDSDMDRINGITNVNNRVENGKYNSLVISFSLGSGQYATMCLRELLKRSTEWFTDSNMSKPEKESFWKNFCDIS
ncbi:pseudouridylate synthase 7-like [Histomonas meleagridis]|uniref:pseudouridylate synthase 7-like n=1 Tax=Histomonas meleagridis TaxID=135588 RepID=UPI00355A0259|nr:pseudouridylate synthase 7-like [Histomonas meleagridis]